MPAPALNWNWEDDVRSNEALYVVMKFFKDFFQKRKIKIILSKILLVNILKFFFQSNHHWSVTASANRLSALAHPSVWNVLHLEILLPTLPGSWTARNWLAANDFKSDSSWLLMATLNLTWTSLPCILTMEDCTHALRLARLIIFTICYFIFTYTLEYKLKTRQKPPTLKLFNYVKWRNS